MKFEQTSIGEKALGIALLSVAAVNHVLGAVDVLNASVTEHIMTQSTDPVAVQTLRVEEGLYSQRAEGNFIDGFVYGGLGSIALRRRRV